MWDLGDLLEEVAVSDKDSDFFTWLDQRHVQNDNAKFQSLDILL